jgi:hypothetical protein
MKRPIFILLLIIIAAGSGTFWYLNQPAKKIDRAVDRLFDAVEHKKVSLSPPGDPRQVISEIFAERVSIIGIPKISNEPMAREKLAEKLKMFHELTTLCEFEESARQVKVVGDRAEASRTTTMTVAAGPRFRNEETWEVTFEFEKSDRWRITTIRAEKAD